MYDEEVYKGFVIHALAELRVRGWTVTVHVQKPSGERLPSVADSTSSYEMPILALSAGLARGREIVDSTAMNEHPQLFEVTQDAKHRFHWMLYAEGDVIAQSRKEGYATHEECMQSIRRLIEVAPNTGVSDTTEG